MFELKSVRRSFHRNLTKNSEAASFLDQTTSFETEVQEREPWDFYEWITCNEKPKLFQCFHIQMVVVPFLRINLSAVMFFQRFIFPAKTFRGKIFGAHLDFSLQVIHS